MRARRREAKRAARVAAQAQARAAAQAQAVANYAAPGQVGSPAAPGQEGAGMALAGLIIGHATLAVGVGALVFILVLAAAPT
ncbi:MAG: hypothetical protein LBG60_00990 [Bifidobacteriaceae bacterium]|nr:hypothetical protein [Bifidobacteriaceae bacterium]